MKILHTIDNLYIKSGGPSVCVYDLLTGLNTIDCNTDIILLKDNKNRIIGNKETWIKTFDCDKKTPFHYSSTIKNILKKETDYDIYHTNGMWLYCNYITAEIAQKKGKPYVITPHGTLYPQALANSAWKKNIMLFLLLNKNINNASCIHVTCEQEMVYIRKLGYTPPIAVIPNSVNIDNLNSYKKYLCNERKKRKIGYLGRLHPRKKIETLIYALNMLDLRENIELIIMGAGDIKYELFLKNEVKRLNIKNVIFTGFISGDEKYKNLASLSALFVPSDFENFGMIIPEALMMQVPVMASLGTPWENLNKYNCGWWVANDVKTVALTIEKAVHLSEQERKTMGDNGQNLIINNYSINHIAKKVKMLYEWILFREKRPDFVYL